MRKIGVLKVNEDYNDIEVDLGDLKPGLNDVKNHIIKLDSKKNVVYVIDKICNHAGGRLIIKKDKAVCPMHQWELNLETLEYNNSHVCKDKKDFVFLPDGNILINSAKRSLSNPYRLDTKKGKLIVRWLNHACVVIDCNGKSIMTDPWLFGPSFLTGWWLKETSPEDSIELLKTVDYIYISHNHPDHLHAETLSLLQRNTPIITANFHSSSSKVMLEKLGFTNIIVPDFYQIYELATDFQFSILKSGDFRDDSGIYINANGHELLLAVDSNFLNNHVLPQNIDLFMTSFAGGASGFPVCYSNFSEEEKSKIIKRSRNSIKAKVINYVKSCTPKYFMPYAGMFAEYADRDKYILEKNYKINVSEYVVLLDNHDTEVLFPNSDITLLFSDGDLDFLENKNVRKLKSEDRDFYIDNLKKEYPYDADAIINYLKDSGYNGQQIIQIIPTDNDFDKVTGKIIFADFAEDVFKIIEPAELLESHPSKRVMKMRVRSEIMMCVVKNYLPWEDFLIGFQMRAFRSPNVYESDFWYHFTNEYVAKENFKYSSYCGSCTIIDQNPIWYED